ncbi:MAG: 6,7-dimethyl-8-ribityllumazine synthase [Flavobacteriales bacterium]|nr:6,7-dimethyl-8-ribityllumazine synthase [Flavobacteriales bacterium]MBL6873835.1 6,7-dimethyl-8-ribityllumazine synthase [Flavobacteriales bacterium]
MATENKNLSHYNLEDVPSAKGMKIGIVVSEWNANITENLFSGAYGALVECGCKREDIIRKNVPGSFELPLAAQFLLESKNVDAVICLGSVIQGETKHFDYVCQTTANGIKDVSLKYNKAVIFGVLTDNTMQQAIDRSGGKHGNKGVEASITAIKMVNLRKNL